MLVGVALAPGVGFVAGVAVGSTCPPEGDVAVGPGRCVGVGVGCVLVGVGVGVLVGVGVGVGVSVGVGLGVSVGVGVGVSVDVGLGVSVDVALAAIDALLFEDELPATGAAWVT